MARECRAASLSIRRRQRRARSWCRRLRYGRCQCAAFHARVECGAERRCSEWMATRLRFLVQTAWRVGSWAVGTPAGQPAGGRTGTLWGRFVSQDQKVRKVKES